MERPNILLIMCDQLRADALGAYGASVVLTPHIDALAADGAVFDSAYTPSPVCVPARASLITGEEPAVNACFDNDDPMPDSTTFMDALTGVGYRTHGIGKMHFQPDGQAMRGFESRSRGEEFGCAETDDYLAFVSDQGFDHVEHPHGLRDEMYYVPQLSPVSEPAHHSRWVADESVRFLEERPVDRPFLLWASFIAPHPPFAPPSPWHRMYEPSLMPEPFRPDGGEGLLTTYNDLQNRYKYRDGGWDRRLVQLIKAYYASSVSYVDAQIGRIVTELKAKGLFESTVIILTADHGEFLGDYGCFGKRSFLDAAARIPLIVRGPGFVPSRRSEPVSLIDVYPTILEAADVEGSPRAGVSLRSPIQRQAVFGQFQQRELGLYCVITPEWKYIYSALDRREYLIDRLRDPRETQNLAYNVRVSSEVEQMRAMAVAHFPDLDGLDLAARTGNRPLQLGAPPLPEVIDGVAAMHRDRDSATLVVRGGRWIPEPVPEQTAEPLPPGRPSISTDRVPTRDAPPIGSGRSTARHGETPFAVGSPL